MEGDPGLRSAFASMLEKRYKGKMPTIIMGGAKSNTVHDYQKSTSNPSVIKLLLIDLDAADSDANKKGDLENHQLLDHQDCVFYMIQEMEAWFIHQPAAIDMAFPRQGTKGLVSGHVPTTRPVSDIKNPKEHMHTAFRAAKRPRYKEVNDGANILTFLDIGQLCRDDAEFKKLIDRLDQTL